MIDPSCPNDDNRNDLGATKSREIFNPSLQSCFVVIPMSTNLPIINIDTLNTLQQDMEEVFEEVYQSAFISIKENIDQLRQQPDIDEITRLFHSIKSPAASLGAERLADLAKQYEAMGRRDNINNLLELVDNLEQQFDELMDTLQDIVKLPFGI